MLKAILSILVCLLVGSVQPAYGSTGMDFGDAFALVLGLAIGIVGILACLGKYARHAAYQQI